jgi:hypothetical protein
MGLREKIEVFGEMMTPSLLRPFTISPIVITAVFGGVIKVISSAIHAIVIPLRMAGVKRAMPFIMALCNLSTQIIVEIAQPCQMPCSAL